MMIQEIFQELIKNQNEERLYNFILEIKESIPENERIGKGIVWSLRQVRKEIKKEIPLKLQKESLKILIKSEIWEIRKLTAFLASNCAIEERLIPPYIRIIKKAANDTHFGVRESAQMATRELLQAFPKEMIQIYNQWITDKNEFTRRCVSESLRPVLVEGRNWIKENPKVSIKILKHLNKDTSLYVRKSVANNLSDISRKYPDLVLTILREWLVENNYDKRTFFIARKACRNIVKTNQKEVDELLKGQSTIR